MDAFVPAARLPRRRIDRATARRLERLARAAHRFHRFAHHPLCDRYAGEVVRVGRRVRLCRGCTYAVAGGLAGGAAGIAVGSSGLARVTGLAGLPLGIAISILATVAATVLLVGTMYVRRRVTKVVTRAVPAALFALAIACGVASLRVPGIAAAFGAAAIVVGLRVLYGKRGADRAPCTTCPERSLSPCSGFAPIVSRERAFQRAARRLLA